MPLVASSLLVTDPAPAPLLERPRLLVGENSIVPAPASFHRAASPEVRTFVRLATRAHVSRKASPSVANSETQSAHRTPTNLRRAHTSRTTPSP